ncbi:copper resistance protein B [Sphingomonas melonis]|uniref:copper resistance protein B n=1 Tax=Sphingomonas melonis TaxID=152682 RepID=UPI0035C7A5E7
MTRARAALAATAMFGFAAPVAAQDHSMHGMNMPGMSMPAAKKPVAKKATAKPPAKGNQPARTTRAKTAPAKAAPAPMEGMDHSAMQGMTMPAQGQQPAQDEQSMPGMQMSGDAHVGHTMPGTAMEGIAQTGTALPAGNAPPPPVPTDHAADSVYGADAMMMGRHHLQQHHGGGNFYQVMFNLAEYQFRNGRDGYRWDGEAWYGGDINRLFVKTEGEGTFREGVEDAEVQALYSRAIGPYFNLQAGVRQDLGRSPKRTYATVGFEGLAPGQFEFSGAAFLSNKGDLLGRLEGYYDQRVTQRLILQPRAELNFAAQDVPENRIGSGLSNAELGLRLRYEIRREFAPYIGVSWDRKVGDTARFARTAGEDATARSIVAGIRVWF